MVISLTIEDVHLIAKMLKKAINVLQMKMVEAFALLFVVME